MSDIYTIFFGYFVLFVNLGNLASARICRSDSDCNRRTETCIKLHVWSFEGWVIVVPKLKNVHLWSFFKDPVDLKEANHLGSFGKKKWNLITMNPLFVADLKLLLESNVLGFNIQCVWMYMIAMTKRFVTMDL